MSVMKRKEFLAAVRKAREVCAHVVLYADDQGYGCDGTYIKVTKSDLLAQTKGQDADTNYMASWGSAEHNKDILFLN